MREVHTYGGIYRCMVFRRSLGGYGTVGDSPMCMEELKEVMCLTVGGHVEVGQLVFVEERKSLWYLIEICGCMSK